MKRCVAFLAAVLLSFAFSMPLPAADAVPSLLPGAAAGKTGASISTSGPEPWTLNADKMVAIDDGVIMEAAGKVLLQRGTDYLKADFARYYTATNWVFVKGHVELRMGRDMLNATEAEFDLNNRTGWLKKGSVFIAGPHMYVAGEKVDKLNGDRYVFKDAKVTACDGDKPAWSLAADNAEVELDGYAKLSHAKLNVVDVPVAEAPYLVLPAKTTRQSGLLMPDFGYSTVNGAFWSQPYYQVVDPGRDLTFYATYMSKVGFMPGIEYRSHEREGSKTWLGLDFLYDKHTFLNESGDPVNTTDRHVNSQEERYWLRGMGDGEIADSGWRYRYDLDYVSDQNFLRQFRDMQTGFHHTHDTLYDTFGRSLPLVDKNRVSRGFLYKEWDRFMVSAGVRYEQVPYLGHGNKSRSEDTTVQSVPLNAYLYRGALLDGFPLEFQAEASSTYEYREKGVRGLRTEVHPELTMPVMLPGASVLLTGGVRQDWYNASHEHVSSRKNYVAKNYERGSGYSDRLVPEGGIETFTQLSRTWQMPERRIEAADDNLGEGRWTGVMHRIQPRFSYGWIPDVSQNDNPFFEEMDRIRPSQTARLAVTNILTAKNSVLKKEGGEYSYEDRFSDPLRWEVSAGYDIEEAHRTRFRGEYGRKPFTDVYSYLQFNALDWLSFWNRLYVSVYGDGVTRSDTGATLKVNQWGSWGLSYSTRNPFYNYRDEMKRDRESDMKFTTEQKLLTNTFTFKPTSNIALYYQLKNNLVTGKMYESNFIVGYYHQCFHILAQVKTKSHDDSYRLILEIPGLNF